MKTGNSKKERNKRKKKLHNFKTNLTLSSIVRCGITKIIQFIPTKLLHMYSLVRNNILPLNILNSRHYERVKRSVTIFIIIFL